MPPINSQAAAVASPELNAQARPRVAVIIPVYNEEKVIGRVLDAIPREHVDVVIVVDDGSTDSTPTELEKRDVQVIRHEKQLFIGAAIRDGLRKAKELGIDIVCVFAGNGKDDPQELPLLLRPIIEQGYDFVQGSRYLPGGRSGKMPRHRRIVTKVYPLLVRFFTGVKITDGTNGFRAYRLQLLDDPEIDLDQPWLSECLEYYFSLRVFQQGYSVTEVPVSKIYPDTAVYSEYTKVRPGIGWLNRLKPLFFLGFRLRK